MEELTDIVVTFYDMEGGTEKELLRGQSTSFNSWIAMEMAVWMKKSFAGGAWMMMTSTKSFRMECKSYILMWFESE